MATLYVASLLSGCATIYNPATERQETVLDSSVEIALGNLARAQMGLGSLQVGRVSPDQFSRVQTIGQRIARVSDRQDVPYRFGVIRDKSLNAFTLPGGTIYVHTGILDKATEDELACVIAHEIGHVAARHVAKHLQADLGFTVLLQLAGAAGVGAESARIANSLYGLFSNGFSRQDELQADRLGIRYAGKAGYDPRGMISFFEKIEAEHPEGAAEKAFAWKSTHPLTSERIAKAKEEINLWEGMKFCPTCGQEYPAKARFCERDGTPLRKKGK
ncbi:MAG: M48 family metalloprotease [Candidatus Omnitrophica bacterium]|nr:M48 family metalloprotease [Candidatus Omnitrophota bacterium]